MNTRVKYQLIAFLSVFTIYGYADSFFPDGEKISGWFSDKTIVDINSLGEKYNILDYGVLNDSTILQTDKLQKVIDLATVKGGVVVVPKGTFLTGALFFKPNTHLYIEEGGKIKGSDDISDYPVVDTRIEGQNIKYFPAIINADKVDGFTVSGKGTIDGNGLRYWKSFWLRRKFNPDCTNLDEMRPRVLIVSNSQNVQVSGIRLINSPYWTTHFYKCENVKMLNLYIYAPAKPVGAPSSDAVDIDVCKNFLISDCFMSVNDDAISLKGGKGPWADKSSDNGSNVNVIIEDCNFGYCHSALTCGSESIHNRNIILRNCRVDNADRLLHLKMRPDTPQLYEYLLIENIKGNMKYMLYVKPWTQFFDLKDRKDVPLSLAKNITINKVDLVCDKFVEMEKSEQYLLSDFEFKNMVISCKEIGIDPKKLDFISIHNLSINNKKY